MHIFLQPNAVEMLVIKSGKEEEEIATHFLKSSWYTSFWNLMQ